jgi:hypothetical protein
LTPNEKSLTKARYFRSILRVARRADETLSIRILSSLINENTTDGVPDDVLRAENAAVDAFRKLTKGLETRDGMAATGWNNACFAVSRWLDSVNECSSAGIAQKALPL